MGAQRLIAIILMLLTSCAKTNPYSHADTKSVKLLLIRNSFVQSQIYEKDLPLIRGAVKSLWINPMK